MQLVADLHGQHAVQHEEHLVLFAVDVEVRSGSQRRQLGLPETNRPSV
jgi:hypothetical protein